MGGVWVGGGGRTLWGGAWEVGLGGGHEKWKFWCLFDVELSVVVYRGLMIDACVVYVLQVCKVCIRYV